MKMYTITTWKWLMHIHTFHVLTAGECSQIASLYKLLLIYHQLATLGWHMWNEFAVSITASCNFPMKHFLNEEEKQQKESPPTH